MENRIKVFMGDVARVNALINHANLMVPHTRLQRPQIHRAYVDKEVTDAAAALHLPQHPEVLHHPRRPK